MAGDEDKGWIVTFTGRKVCPLAMRVEDICLEDIAHALSMKCRYTGHVRHFYSVAQHSTMMSILDLPGPKDWRLLHDAAEAYLPDIASPIKRFFPIMVDAEHHIERCIAERFGLPDYDTCHKLVKIADLAMMRWEGEHLMPPVSGAGWMRGELREEMPQEFTSWTPEYAERQFLREAERCQLRN